MRDIESHFCGKTTVSQGFKRRQLLRSAQFKGLRVFFGTVDISNQYMQIIKDAVAHAPGDAVISANGETGALKQAWRTIGEKPTVSQKIEKAGAMR
jgi:hypothetical protein